MRSVEIEELAKSFMFTMTAITLAESILLKPAIQKKKPFLRLSEKHPASANTSVSNSHNSISPDYETASSRSLTGTLMSYDSKSSIAEVNEGIPAINLTSPNGHQKLSNDHVETKVDKRKGKHKYHKSDGGTMMLSFSGSFTSLFEKVSYYSTVELLRHVPFVQACFNERDLSEDVIAKVPRIPYSPLEFEYKHCLAEYENTGSKIANIHHSFQIDDNDFVLEMKRLIDRMGKWKSKLNFFATLTDKSQNHFIDISILHPDQVANGITIIDWSIQGMIDPRKDFLLERGTSLTNCSVFTDFFNFLTRIIESSILDCSEAEERAFRIQRWNKVALKLRELRNFNALKAVISGLSTPPILRLKKTWQLVSKKHLSSIENLRDLMSEQNNYAKYREALNNAPRPAIPFYGVMMYDMTYIQAAAKRNHDSLSEDKRLAEIQFQFEYFKSGPTYDSDPKFGMCSHKEHTRENSFFAKKPEGSSTSLNILQKSYCDPIFCIHWLLTRKYVTESSIDTLSKIREPSTSRSTELYPALVSGPPTRRKSIVEYLSFHGSVEPKIPNTMAEFDKLSELSVQGNLKSPRIPDSSVLESHRRTQSAVNSSNSFIKEVQASKLASKSMSRVQHELSKQGSAFFDKRNSK
ncbi:hypothetical protein MP638_006340 [Amoeboaphelidium occidentale]|nr:hypothetical protein MP638_006340 [Amoeboaphelidium occidentale]